jgi:hypothetical protein
MEDWWNDTEKGNGNIGSKACPNASSTTIHPTLTGLGSRLALRGETPAANHLSHVAVGFDLNY